jgi:hypothetical protein
MKLLAIALASLLLGALTVGTPGSCSCASRDLCINGDSASNGIAAALKLSVTLELRSGTNKQLSDELSRITGKRIVVLPTKPNELINVDIKHASLWDMLETFSMRGLVTIEGEDFSKLQAVRKALAGGKKVSVCIKGASLGRVVGELSGLTGQPLRVTSGDEKALVTLSAKAITLEGILSRLSAKTGAQISMK